MADAADSKSAEGNLVRVRLSPRALRYRNDLASYHPTLRIARTFDCAPVVPLASISTALLHIYTECPEGKIIAIAKRDPVATDDPKAMQGLEWCSWCLAQDRIDSPR